MIAHIEEQLKTITQTCDYKEIIHRPLYKILQANYDINNVKFKDNNGTFVNLPLA